jgi:hypothetical protein
MVFGFPIHGLVIIPGAAAQGPIEGETPSPVAEVIVFEQVVEGVGQWREVVGEHTHVLIFIFLVSRSIR